MPDPTRRKVLKGQVRGKASEQEAFIQGSQPLESPVTEPQVDPLQAQAFQPEPERGGEVNFDQELVPGELGPEELAAVFGDDAPATPGAFAPDDMDDWVPLLEEMAATPGSGIMPRLLLAAIAAERQQRAEDELSAEEQGGEFGPFAETLGQ